MRSSSAYAICLILGAIFVAAWAVSSSSYDSSYPPLDTAATGSAARADVSSSINRELKLGESAKSSSTSPQDIPQTTSDSPVSKNQTVTPALPRTTSVGAGGASFGRATTVVRSGGVPRSTTHVGVASGFVSIPTATVPTVDGNSATNAPVSVMPVAPKSPDSLESTAAAEKPLSKDLSKHENHAVRSASLDMMGGPLKVLFLSADTGGGHRASAESLAKSFQMHYPGTIYDLVDVWTDHGGWPYKKLVPTYKHLSANPKQWGLFYHLSNNFLYEIAYDFHSWLTCERRIRRRIKEYSPDVVVSVHPTMNNVPLIATRKISKKEGRHIPFFTVVTDFGSAHTTWFQKRVDKIFVASTRLAKLAKRRGRISKEKLAMSGLPIRHEFGVHSELLDDRTTEHGQQYQAQIKEELGLNPNGKVVLVMGGGEGVGSLSNIVDSLYANLRKSGVDATICVVCGRNEKLKQDLETRDWNRVLEGSNDGNKKKRFLEFLRRNRSKRIRQTLDTIQEKEKLEEGEYRALGNVDVVGLGFVKNMAERMVAADVLVTKAGPGTIAEAAAVGLPVMLTSFLPGQEAGNVNVVLDGGFGDYCEDPDIIADEVSCWLKDSQLLKEMSQNAKEVGVPHAASDIAFDIGEATHTVMRNNIMNQQTAR